jgi:hypothetical protein
MRRWRAGDGRVIAELGPGRFAVIAEGRVVRVAAPHDDAVDDDYYSFTYDVAGDALWVRIEVRTFGEDERRRSESIDLAGLVLLDHAAAPTAHEVHAAMDAQARDARAREDYLAAQVEELARAFAVPASLAEARARLAERAVRWEDDVAIAMLALFEELCRAPLLDDVVRALDAAARHATFAIERPDPPGAGVPEPDQPLPPRFEQACLGLAIAAEGQEWADANQNATAYRRAERWLRVAAARMSSKGRQTP